jgi:hypothetical protein
MSAQWVCENDNVKSLYIRQGVLFFHEHGCLPIPFVNISATKYVCAINIDEEVIVVNKHKAF